MDGRERTKMNRSREGGVIRGRREREREWWREDKWAEEKTKKWREIIKRSVATAAIWLLARVGGRRPSKLTMSPW